jgi:toxin-antitoxin system PIN domain toxin
MLVDANLLLYAVDRRSVFHVPARHWLAGQLNGTRRVGLPWQSLSAFLRIVTNPRVTRQQFSPQHAWARVTDWLDQDVVWIPEPGPSYRDILGELIARYSVRGDLMPDTQLAALAIEHGLTVCSADTDFARFTEIRWENPVAPGPV